MSKIIKKVNITNLSKKYKNRFVFYNYTEEFTSENINFLVGVNGSGKSTLIKCITNLINYKGSIETYNLDISYIPEKSCLPSFTHIKQFIKCMTKASDEDINLYMNKYGLDKFSNKTIIELSKGNRQKINLIIGILKDADIYLFDEPLEGLDKGMVNIFMDDLKELMRKNSLIIISTHYLNEYKFKNKKVYEIGNYDYRS